MAHNTDFLRTPVSCPRYLSLLRIYLLSASTPCAQAKLYAVSQHTIAVSKPPMLALLSNVGNNTVPNWNVPGAGYKPGETLVDVLTCNKVVADDKGGILVSGKAGNPQVSCVAISRDTPQSFITVMLPRYCFPSQPSTPRGGCARTWQREQTATPAAVARGPPARRPRRRRRVGRSCGRRCCGRCRSRCRSRSCFWRARRACSWGEARRRFFFCLFYCGLSVVTVLGRACLTLYVM